MKQLQLYNCGPAEVGNVIGFAPLFLLNVVIILRMVYIIGGCMTNFERGC